MHRKDLDAIARAMKSSMPTKHAAQVCQWIDDCVALADAFDGKCAGFDRAKFLHRCGLYAKEHKHDVD